MGSRSDDLTNLQAQLAEKNDLVVALTSQLERTATQLDRLSRAGAERQGIGGAASPALSPEVANRLTSALEEWQEFQPTGRIERIESGIDQILELLRSPAMQPRTAPAVSPAQKESAAASSVTEDFWAATKARLLGEAAPVARQPSPEPERVIDQPLAEPVAHPGTIDPDAPLVFADAPPPPEVIQDAGDPEELAAGIKTRDIYIQYLVSRVRLAETKSYFPTDWAQVANAPNRLRERLESLETVLKDHLRQAEVANSLERALLARERAKLSQIKQNLENQIKKMAAPLAPPTPAPPVSVPPEAPEHKGDQESRWKRIFSR